MQERGPHLAQTCLCFEALRCAFEHRRGPDVVGCVEALYSYLGGLPGLRQVETAPMIRTLKRFGALAP